MIEDVHTLNILLLHRESYTEMYDNDFSVSVKSKLNDIKVRNIKIAILSIEK